MEDGTETPYFGILQEILQVDFETFNVVLFGGDWYKIVEEGPHTTLKNDKCGFRRLNMHPSNILPKTRSFDDVWIYPGQVDQCFFVPMTRQDSNWSLVVPVWPRYEYRS
jgi:hypothetical protein